MHETKMSSSTSHKTDKADNKRSRDDSTQSSQELRTEYELLQRRATMSKRVVAAVFGIVLIAVGASYFLGYTQWRVAPAVGVVGFLLVWWVWWASYD